MLEGAKDNNFGLCICLIFVNMFDICCIFDSNLDVIYGGMLHMKGR